MSENEATGGSREGEARRLDRAVDAEIGRRGRATPRARSDVLGMAAIGFSVLAGGGGLGLNVKSNGEVLNKLEQVTRSVDRLDERLKASESHEARLRALEQDVAAIKARERRGEK